MTDYLVYREGRDLKLQLHSQYAEEDLLLRNFEPGKDLVTIPDVVGVTSDNLNAEARRKRRCIFVVSIKTQEE